MDTSATSLPPKKEPLTDDEVQECSRAFEEIGEAYPNLQFEKMQEIFCGISNKVARLGKERWDDIGSTLKMKFFGRLGDHVRHPLDFATAADFDRYMNANVAAARMIGFSLTTNYCFADWQPGHRLPRLPISKRIGNASQMRSVHRLT